MNKKAENKIRRLSQNQAKVLKEIISYSSTVAGTVVPGSYISNASGISGNMLGGTVSALQRNDIIQPFGREERQFNWELTDPDLIQGYKEDPDTLIKLINRIAGEK